MILAVFRLGFRFFFWVQGRLREGEGSFRGIENQTQVPHEESGTCFNCN